jgi:hypothetical protein
MVQVHVYGIYLQKANPERTHRYLFRLFTLSRTAAQVIQDIGG